MDLHLYHNGYIITVKQYNQSISAYNYSGDKQTRGTRGQDEGRKISSWEKVLKCLTSSIAHREGEPGSGMEPDAENQGEE